MTAPLPPPRGRPIDERTRSILGAAHIDGTHLRLPDRLSPTEYSVVKQVVQALGGSWTRNVQAFTFARDTDVNALITGLLSEGRTPLSARAADGFVSTPPDLGERLCAWPCTDLAWLPPGARVLEPSAGHGALVGAILRVNPQVAVTAVEPDRRRALALRNSHDGVRVHTSTFEEFAADAQAGGERFAAVVMNPPFAVPGNRAIWIEHILLAWELLAPGARLVAVVPASLTYHQGRQHQDLRELTATYGGHQPLPDDTFAAAGAGVRTCILWLTRPVEAGPERFGWRTYTGTDHPVRVATPRLTGEAVTAAPVQIWRDEWRGSVRILRYRAQCVVCGWLLWSFDDGQNDPRGVLGDFSAGYSLDAADYDADGPSIGLCPRCANTFETFRTGLARAETRWTPNSRPDPDTDALTSDQPPITGPGKQQPSDTCRCGVRRATGDERKGQTPA
jgi:hypothetical protein